MQEDSFVLSPWIGKWWLPSSDVGLHGVCSLKAQLLLLIFRNLFKYPAQESSSKQPLLKLPTFLRCVSQYCVSFCTYLSRYNYLFAFLFVVLTTQLDISIRRAWAEIKWNTTPQQQGSWDSNCPFSKRMTESEVNLHVWGSTGVRHRWLFSVCNGSQHRSVCSCHQINYLRNSGVSTLGVIRGKW